MTKIGVMQGRLLPKYMGRYQAHPVGYWKDEYEIARSLELDSIEFILDFHLSHLNPLLNDNGINSIIDISSKTGVKTKSVCADYFMERPIFDKNKDVRIANDKIIKKLLHSCSKIGVEDIVIPCVDKSSLTSHQDKEVFISEISKYLNILEDLNINFSLETDLPPEDFFNLINEFDSKNITVNYDIGNSASLGYSFIDELKYYGDRISNIHIKDRVYKGSSVILGTGNADIRSFLQEVSKIDYKGLYIMQAYRDDEGVRVFENQLNFVRDILDEK